MKKYAILLRGVTPTGKNRVPMAELRAALSDAGLLDAETNLKYGVKYLRGAYLVADGNHDAAVKWYSRGYYYEAKRKGLLEETGLRT